MKCYYEVLNVSRDADGSEIKNSYRKLALKWHPDKNLSNPEEAKEQFQTVQNAYEVLSDPQERAWYDNHREQLLRGAGSDFNDESLDLIPFFTASCYKGFGDDEKGFYSVYREVFKKLIAEEVDYLDDPEDVSKMPEFGMFDTDYEKVHEFYSYWLSFSTSKSYTWLDKYNIREADNRKILKLVEKENNKIRQKAKKERNEEIRRLVSFVRKRDKRVIAHTKLMEEKAEENKKKAADSRRQKIIKRQEELEEEKKRQKDIGVYTMNNFQEQLEEIEKHLAAEFGDSEEDYSTLDSSDEDEVLDPKKGNVKQIESDEELYIDSNQNLYCSACNKIFKTIKSFENHEKSKKHKENVMNLKVDVDLTTSDDEKSDIVANKNDSSLSDSAELELSDEKTQKSTKLKKKQNKKPAMVVNDTDSDCDLAEILNMDSNSRNRKARRSKAPEKKSKKVKNNNKMNTAEVAEDLTLNTDKSVESDVVNRLENEEDSIKPLINGDTEEKPSKKSQQTKAKGKEKKLSQKKKIEIMNNIDISNLDTSHCCAICKNEFSSKNKLFDHLKKTGHQIYLPGQVASAPTCSINNKSSKKEKKTKQKA